MDIKNQTFFVLGVSKSGFSACNYILSNGGKCFFYEENVNPKTEKAIEEIKNMGGVFVTESVLEDSLNNSEIIVISPGVPINHRIAVKAKELNKRIMGELEFGFLLFLPLIVAVTGTNGKTTTVSLIEHILKENKTDVCAVGNIGIPITSEIDNITRNTVCVTEVSSFQLESVHFFNPHIACMLNISPDHLERHYSMENYIYLKKRIFKNQTSDEFAVLNYDDMTVRDFNKEINSKVVWVSVKEKVDGAYLYDRKLFYKDEFIIDEEDLSLMGEHNVYNSLFSIAVCKIIGVPSSVICAGLKNFKGVKHRIELVCEKNGVKYYDDSKATNTASTITAIKTLKAPKILILGGSEKGEDYDNLFREIKENNVKHVVITGDSRVKMFDTAGRMGVTDITFTPNYIDAFKIASTIADKGDAVLLSPACASFDCFSDYKERGDIFCKTVGELN